MGWLPFCNFQNSREVVTSTIVTKVEFKMLVVLVHYRNRSQNPLRKLLALTNTKDRMDRMVNLVNLGQFSWLVQCSYLLFLYECIHKCMLGTRDLALVQQLKLFHKILVDRKLHVRPTDICIHRAPVELKINKLALCASSKHKLNISKT